MIGNNSIFGELAQDAAFWSREHVFGAYQENDLQKSFCSRVAICGKGQLYV